MSYQFEAERMYEDETLEHEPEFEHEILTALKSCRHLIYLGWHTHVPLLDHYANWFEEIVVVEAWPQNAAQAAIEHPHVLVRVADIRLMAATEIPPDSCVLWQQGPEHVESSVVRELLKVWQHTAKAIILETPNGFRNQGEDDLNPFEKHVSAWAADDFSALGFACALFMEPHREGAVIAYWARHQPTSNVGASSVLSSAREPAVVTADSGPT
jgi:hypothetical protein